MPKAKTLLKSVTRLTNRPIRLVCSAGAYAVVLAGESIGCGFDYGHALSVFESVASR